jgi:signal transduction histidine kinase/ActR/RegA family two-component response regulator
MANEVPAAHPRAPSASQLRTFAVLSLAYLVIMLAAAHWAADPGPADANIVVVYGIAILVADFSTALLLAVLYRHSGRSALLVLASAYVYSGLMAGLHMASFPGALEHEALFGGALTEASLYLAWRLGTSAILLAVVVQEARHAQAAERRGARLFAAFALTVAAAAVLAALAARAPLEAWLGAGFPAIAATIEWLSVALCMAAFAVIWRKRAFGDVLYLWLGLVLVAMVADLVLANLAGAPFAMGWHAARASHVVAACLLLAFLLGDLAGDDQRIAPASMLAAYGGAVAVTLAAVYLRWFLDPWLRDSVPYTTIYGAVAIAVWFGGVGPAVLAMVLGYAFANVRYIEPRGMLATDGASGTIELALFALSCALVIVLGEAMRRARDRYRASEAELKERARQLQRADNNKSQFLAVMAHELRNPLAPLRTGLALLRMQHEDAATRETHDMMERQIAQLTRLIDDLLDVSRIDRGKLELRSERVAVDAVLRTALDTAKPNIDAKGHVLVVRNPPHALFVEGDPVRLAQVVSNLLNNAAKFTPPNGHIELAAREEDGQVLLGVSDNGVGIAPEHLKEVFDMFVQLDSSHATAAGGLGLGLTLARSIIERHRGSIEARSAGRGRGSQFLVRLPRAGPPAQKEAQEKPQAAMVRRRVLVVDDNVDAAQTLAQYLRMDGHRVESALDGEAALRIAEVLHPDVAFIDLNMPRMDGVEVAKRLRVTSWGRAARLVALTGMGQQSDIARTREAGFDEHITKPADLKRVSRLAAGIESDARCP